VAHDFASAFLAWEDRTRGHELASYPVALEPRFEPFVLPSRSKGTLEASAPWRTLFASDPVVRAVPGGSRKSEQLEVQLRLPERFLLKPGLAARFAASLHALSGPMAFELIGSAKGVVVQFCCSAVDAEGLRAALGAFFPEVRVASCKNYLRDEWVRRKGAARIIDLGLFKGFHLPLARGGALRPDPLIGVVGAMDKLERDELGFVQVMFAPVAHLWGSELWKAFSADGSESGVLPLVRAKIAEPFVCVVVRIGALSGEASAATDRAMSIANEVTAASRSAHNFLIALESDSYPADIHEADVLDRTTHRAGMILGLSELLTLVHLPSGSMLAKSFGRRNASRDRNVPKHRATGLHSSASLSLRGPQYQYLQAVIKRVGMSRGYTVRVGAEIHDAEGSVAVCLSRDGLSIACIICSSTDYQSVVGQSKKCIDDGFDFVILVGSERNVARRITALLQKTLSGRAIERTCCVAAESFAQSLSELELREGKRAGATDADEFVEPKRVIKAREAAAYLGLAPQTLAKMRVAGSSPPYHKVGRLVVYNPSELDAWLAARQRRSTSDSSG
jgi:predicted DNA-binding transcriptional regulator AlpA